LNAPLIMAPKTQLHWTSEHNKCYKIIREMQNLQRN
jgi:hypothetical protein